MADKITYLLGAGASANTIPVVSQMADRINTILFELRDIYNKAANNHPYVGVDTKIANTLREHTNILRGILNDLEWLINESGKHYSIDTLAKKFHLVNNQMDYLRLKKALITYFTIEQLTFYIDRRSDDDEKDKAHEEFEKNMLDKRYDSFIAALAHKSKKGLELNSNIKILSWNYDLQFELSLKRFTRKRITDIKKEYQIFPLLNDNLDNGKLTDMNQFAIRKLNGNAIYTTGIINNNIDDVIFDEFDFNTDVNNIERIALFLQDYKKLDFSKNNTDGFLNFAWEGDFDFEGSKHRNYETNIEEAEKIAAETEILVVIGYSFPIFNRAIDNRLFNKMDKLKKVYIQDKFPEKIKSTMVNAFKILQRIPLLSDTIIATYPKSNPIVEFQETNSLDQFVIPYELYSNE